MSDTQRKAMQSVWSAIQPVWQLVSALVVVVGLYYGLEARIDRIDQREVSQSQLGTERRLALTREFEAFLRLQQAKDAQQDSALSALVTRATAGEIAMGRMDAHLARINESIGDLTREIRASRTSPRG